MNIKTLLTQFASLTFVGAIILLIQFVISKSFNLTINILEVHGFIFAIFMLCHAFVIYLKSKENKYFPYLFMLASMTKMFMSIIFLIPQIKLKTPDAKEYIIYFMIIYFIYLITEIFLIVKLLKDKD